MRACHVLLGPFTTVQSKKTNKKLWLVSSQVWEISLKGIGSTNQWLQVGFRNNYLANYKTDLWLPCTTGTPSFSSAFIETCLPSGAPPLTKRRNEFKSNSDDSELWAKNKINGGATGQKDTCNEYSWACNFKHVYTCINSKPFLLRILAYHVQYLDWHNQTSMYVGCLSSSLCVAKLDILMCMIRTLRRWLVFKIQWRM